MGVGDLGEIWNSRGGAKRSVDVGLGGWLWILLLSRPGPVYMHVESLAWG